MTAGEVMKALEGLGCRRVRQSGSHVRFVSACGKCFTTVPDHGHRDMKIGTLKAIQRDMTPCLGQGWLGV